MPADLPAGISSSVFSFQTDLFNPTGKRSFFLLNSAFPDAALFGQLSAGLTLRLCQGTVVCTGGAAPDTKR